MDDNLRSRSLPCLELKMESDKGCLLTEQILARRGLCFEFYLYVHSLSFDGHRGGVAPAVQL